MRRIVNIITCILLSCVLVLIGVLVFRASYIRLYEAFKDFGLSIAYYFCEIFGIPHNIMPSVIDISQTSAPPINMPIDLEGFKDSSANYFSMLVDKNNFYGWLGHISGVIAVLAKVLVIAAPCIIAVIFVIKALYGRENNKHGKDTIPLKVFKFISRWTYQPIKRFLREYVAFLREHGWIWKIWLAVLGLHFNLGTIFVEFIAYYFYFATVAMQAEIDSGRIYNLATVKYWVINLEQRGELFSYDGERYGLIYDNGLKEEGIYDVLSTYAQAYFIYIIESSLIVSNYSIRTDNLLLDSGNFPLWLTDFFPTNFRRNSRHAHILDFDILRLGKKVLDENPNAGSFEFGVIGITEIGKERGNNLELQEKKKNADEANQKNDKFNSWLKMCRHSATVDNFPFIKVFADEQRPESWGADARDLCDIVNIVSSGELKLAMPFYTIGDMIAEWAFNRFINLYYDFRFRRGDNTLLVHILKSVTAWIWKRNVRIYNRYGFSVLKIEKERGTMDGKIYKKKYYLMSAKIYRKRFATDCFADYFNDMALRTNVGLNDYREYLTECASVNELQAQNSYFINALYGLVGES